MIPLHRVYMPDIKIARKLASFLKAKLSLKTTTEVPRPVCGPYSSNKWLLHVIRPKQTQQSFV